MLTNTNNHKAATRTPRTTRLVRNIACIALTASLGVVAAAPSVSAASYDLDCRSSVTGGTSLTLSFPYDRAGYAVEYVLKTTDRAPIDVSGRGGWYFYSQIYWVVSGQATYRWNPTTKIWIPIQTTGIVYTVTASHDVVVGWHTTRDMRTWTAVSGFGGCARRFA